MSGDSDITLSALAAYPEGSVGKATYDMLKKHGMTVDGNETIAMHDALHAVTGIAPDPAGEELLIVYDHMLSEPEVRDVVINFDRAKVAIAQMRSMIPQIAEEHDRDLSKPYKVACEQELRSHQLIASTLRGTIKQKTGKYWHELVLDPPALLNLPMAMFAEAREVITEFRTRHNNDRVTINPQPTNALLRELAVFSLSPAKDIDRFATGGPAARLGV